MRDRGQIKRSIFGDFCASYGEPLIPHQQVSISVRACAGRATFRGEWYLTVPERDRQRGESKGLSVLVQ